MREERGPFGISGVFESPSPGSVTSVIVEVGTALAVVADGLGGHPAGEVASRIAVDTVLGDRPRDGAGLVAAIHHANRMVIEGAMHDASLLGMATTIVAVVISPHEFTVANVGDSEVLALDEQGAVPLSVLDVVRDNVTFRGFASSSLTQYLGGSPPAGELEVHTYSDPLRSDTRLLLCSDGLTGAVPFAEMEDILRHGRGPEVVAALIDEGRHAGVEGRHHHQFLLEVGLSPVQPGAIRPGERPGELC